MRQPLCQKCGQNINLKTENYLVRSFKGVSVYYHRPCPGVVLSRDSLVTKAIISRAQLSAKEALEVCHRIILEASHGEL